MSTSKIEYILHIWRQAVILSRRSPCLYPASEQAPAAKRRTIFSHSNIYQTKPQCLQKPTL